MTRSMPAWLFAHRPRARLWSRQEQDKLEALIGRATVPQIVEAMAKIGRSRASVVARLHQMGIARPTDITQPLGCTLSGLARHLKIDYIHVWNDFHAGRIRAVRKDKKEYLVRWPDVERYAAYCEQRRIAHEQAIVKLPEPTISKPEFERLTGLSETHSTRYLRGGVVRCWKVPRRWSRSKRDLWEWRVSKADAQRVATERRTGRLQLNVPGYRALQRKSSREIAALRRQRRLGLRTDLRRSMTSVVPGYYTVAEVAEHTGQSEYTLYTHIALGHLRAVRRNVGRRTYMAIHPRSVPAYLTWLKSRRLGGGPRKAMDLAAIHSAGRITLLEAAEKYGVSYSELLRRQTQLHVTRMRNVLTVRAVDVRRTVKNMRRWRKGHHGHSTD
jgi:hypothetical protein